MSHLQLYTFQLCPFAHRVRLTLAEKSLTAELIEIDLKNKPPGFSKISPYGKVPLLQHGDVKVWESAIINDYLDQVFSDPPLMPSSPSDRALATSGSSSRTNVSMQRRTASSSRGMRRRDVS
jgi:glutathione S-transferase